MKVRLSTLMVVFGTRDGCGSPVDRVERGDPQGVPLLLFRSASRWHEDVSRSSSPVLLKWDEETRWGFCSTVSHMLAGKGRAPKAYWATPTIGGSGVEVGACHDGLYDSLTTNIA